MQRGYVLERDDRFWKDYIKGDKLDREAVIKAGYTEEQITSTIIPEMEALGWIGAKKKATVPEQLILGRDRRFWGANVDAGMLNVAKLRESGYTDKQVEEIVEGFRKFGWAKVPEVKSATVAAADESKSPETPPVVVDDGKGVRGEQPTEPKTK